MRILEWSLLLQAGRVFSMHLSACGEMIARILSRDFPHRGPRSGGFRRIGKGAVLNRLKTGILELAKAVEGTILALFEHFHDLSAKIQDFG